MKLGCKFVQGFVKKKKTVYSIYINLLSLSSVGQWFKGYKLVLNQVLEFSKTEKIPEQIKKYCDMFGLFCKGKRVDMQ